MPLAWRHVSSAVVKANGIHLWYEALGDHDGAPLVLVTGLGDQAISWPDEFCWGLADRGFRVIRFDNRDAGLSQFCDEPVDPGAAVTAFLRGEAVAAPYGLVDMAADTVGLLDALELPAVHLVGASLGGMIAQRVAIDHPGRVLSLTSIMATTGDRELLLPEPEVLAMVLQPVPDGLDAAIDAARTWYRTIGSPDHVDDELLVAYAQRAHARSPRRDGTARQLVAIVSSPSREAELATLQVPTLVMHGTADRLVRPEGGRRTARLIPGAELVELEGMGHDMPAVFWAPMIEQITRLAVRTTA